MRGPSRARFAAVAGAAVFLLALLGGLAVAGPAAALLAALAVGIGAGAATLVLAGLTAPTSEAVAPLTGRRVDRVAADPVPAAEPALAPPVDAGLVPPPFIPGGPGAGGPSPRDTARLSPGDLSAPMDLHQTIRLDAETLQYALPDVSAEDILREREGIDEAFLKAGAGIDEPPPASENTGGGAPA